MRAVGIRELKNKLSHYIRLVEAGESILVTHRGTVVAELRSPDTSSRSLELESGLVELAREGRAVPGAPHDPDLYAPRPRVIPDGCAAELLDAERGER